ADEVSAWMASRGVRVARGPATAPAPANTAAAPEATGELPTPPPATPPLAPTPPPPPPGLPQDSFTPDPAESKRIALPVGPRPHAPPPHPRPRPDPLPPARGLTQRFFSHRSHRFKRIGFAGRHTPPRTQSFFYLWNLWLRKASGDDTEVAADAGEGVDGAVEVFAGVGGGDLGADAGLALGDHREEEADRVDAFLEQALGELLRQRRVVQHHRHDRMRARAQLEAGGFHALAEVRGVRGQPLAQLAGAG